MKTLEQIKDEVARDYDCADWYDLTCGGSQISNSDVNKVAELYAKQFQIPTDTVVAEISVMQERIAYLEAQVENFISIDKSNQGIIETYKNACNRLNSRVVELYDAMQEFCDHVDKGEVRSTKTYNKFKSLINKG